MNNAKEVFVQALMQLRKSVMYGPMRNPYDIMAFPDVHENILTNGNNGISTRALAKALTGEINPVGWLPVTIPWFDPLGWGPHYKVLPIHFFSKPPVKIDFLKRITLKKSNERGRGIR
jgi:beta-N-acetylhexosaminidase